MSWAFPIRLTDDLNPVSVLRTDNLWLCGIWDVDVREKEPGFPNLEGGTDD